MIKRDSRQAQEIASAVFAVVEAMQPHDRAMVDAVDLLLKAIGPLLDQHSELRGFAHEIGLWAGLKFDSPQLAIDWKYDEAIRDNFLGRS